MKVDRAIEILNPEHREHYDGMDEVNEACRMGMEALERARWIPCSERLPQKGKYVLLWSEDSPGVFTGVYFCERFIVNGFWGKVEDLSITHWMPLPELPKEENDETIDG
jgi:hypothetical protein